MELIGGPADDECDLPAAFNSVAVAFVDANGFGSCRDVLRDADLRDCEGGKDYETFPVE